MMKSEQVSPFLLQFIDAQKDFVSNTNSIAFLVFASTIFLMSRKLSLIQDAKVSFSHDWLLCFGFASSICIFASNFILEQSLTGFFSNMYLREMYTQGIEMNINKMEELDKINWICEAGKTKTYLENYQCIRDFRLTHLVIITTFLVILSGIFMCLWVGLNLFWKKGSK